MNSVTARPEYNRFSTGNFSLNEMVTTGNAIFYIVELILCLIAFPINIIFAIVIYNTPTLHKNLRILLVNKSIADAIYSVSRYMICIPLLAAYIFNSEISSVAYCWFAKSLHHWVLGASGVTFFVVVIERCLASVLYRTYESQSYYHAGFILIGFQWTYSFIVTALNQIDKIGKNEPYSRLPCQIEYSTGRVLAIFVALGFILNMVSSLAFYKTVKFNRKLYRQRSWRLKSLTETYQISENVKSISLLIPIIGVMLITSIVSTLLILPSVFIYIFVRETAEHERSSVMTKIAGRGNEISQIFDICAAISKIAFCWGVRSHPDLYRKWHTMFGTVRINPKKEDSFDVKGLDGRKLTFTVIEETQHHFDSLAESWR